MRTSNSIKNTIASLVSNILTILLGFIVQTIFIKTLGTVYLGINSLFLNITSMLNIVELGIGSAIIYNLYEPIAKNNIEKIKSLMSFYKKVYHIIAIVVLLIGISIIPFLNTIVGDTTIQNTELIIIFLMFITDAVCSYLLSYKRSILYADQKNYYVLITHIVCLIIMNFVQIFILINTKNFYLFLIIKIVLRILENTIITIIANKKYKYINEKNNKLDDETRNDIFKKVKALFFHKIGTFIVTGTDNILISVFFGVTTVGLYSNYKLILSAITTLIGQIFSSLNASVGNLLVYKEKEKNYDIFKKIQFLNFWLSSFSSIAILVIMDSFIKLWIGSDYVLPFLVLVTLCINNYWQTMRGSIASFKEAAGIYYEDRYVPLIESVVNIFFSIIFLKICGLAGIFIGTIISNFVLFLYSYPKFVYCKLFNKSYIQYIKEIFSYFAISIITAVITYYLAYLFNFNTLFLKFIINVVISLIVPNVIYAILFYKKQEFKYFLQLINNIRRRIIKNENKK